MTNTLNKIMHNSDEYLLPDTTYTAGSGINIDQNNEISNTGVTSVNGNTGAVTVSEFSASAGGTKVFDYPTTSVEDIVTWCNGGGTAILMKSDGPYVVSKVGTSYITSVRDNSGDGGTFGTGSVYVDMLTYNNNTYALTSSNDVVTYNHFKPGGTATTGYVVTKTANGYEWSAPSGGSSTITVTLAAANWSSQSITVSATGVTASNTVIVAPDPTSMADYTDGGVYCSSQASNSLTFVCDTTPSNDIDVNVVILG